MDFIKGLTLECFNPLELVEEKPKLLQENQQTRELLTLVYQKHMEKFSLSQDFSSRNYRIRSEGYVGLIPLNESYSIRIKPKINIKNIFAMLEYAYNLKSFELLTGNAQLESVEEFFERLAMILAKKVLDRNRKGLYRDYIQRTESLPYLRGKIQLRKSYVSIIRGSTRPICKYEENTADIEDNQILLWVLYKLHQFNISDDNTKKKVRIAFRELVNKMRLLDFSAQDCIDRFYNRLNIDYKPMHGICRFLLEHSGPNIELGTHNFIPFTVYMPTLFECFVAEWLREHLPRKYYLNTQYRATIDPEGKLEFRIDLVISDVESEKIYCVLDTKYKKNVESRAQDIAQVIAYATKMGTENAFLIYPTQDIPEFNFTVGQIRVRGLSFKINENIEESGKLFLVTLLNYLQLI